MVSLLVCEHFRRMNVAVRRAVSTDAEDIGRLLHDFNTEYEDPTPGPRVLAERVRELLDAGAVTVLLLGTEPLGLAVLRFRPAIWAQALDCYLESSTWFPTGAGRGSVGR